MANLRPCIEVPKRFLKLRAEKRQKQKEIKQVLYGHVLPAELWNYIVEAFVVPEDSGIAYFCFKRPEIYYQTTNAFFAGTEAQFHQRILQLQEEAAEIKKYSRSVEDDLLDSPMCTWCNRENCEECPDSNGNKCNSHWSIEPTMCNESSFKDVTELVRTLPDIGYYGGVVICNM